MTKPIAVAVFLALLIVATLFGVARDLYSRERATVQGTIIAVDTGGAANKAQSLRSPALKVRLADGTIVDVAITDAGQLAEGQTIAISEMVMPWGQVWYRLKS